MQKIKKFIPLTAGLTPFVAFAATFEDIIGVVMDILNLLVPLLIAVAVVIFLYGVLKYITAGGSEEARKEARNMMIYGIIGIFVMVAVWGLVNLLIDSLGLEGTTPTVPTLPAL